MGANNQPHANASARATLADVAKLAGVSGSTASIAFSGIGSISAATRQRVLDAAERLNYYGPDPRAKSLREGRSGIVGVILEDRVLYSFRDPMLIATLDGISQELGSASGMLLLTATGEEESSIQSAVFDAAIFLGCSPHLAHSIQVMRQRNVPMVAIEGQHFEGVLAVDLDNREAAATIAGYVFDLGHRRVAAVTLPLDPVRKLRGLSDDLVASGTTAVALHRLEGAREVYPGITGIIAAGTSSDGGFDAGVRLLSVAPDARPTAILAQSDLLAVGVIRAALSLGLRVPEDVSVVGFDGAHIEGFSDFVLTTMVQPAMEKGRAAGMAVNELLAGGASGNSQFTCELRIGTTTAAPPGS